MFYNIKNDQGGAPYFAFWTDNALEYKVKSQYNQKDY